MEGGIERGCHSEGDVGIICGSYSSYIPLSDGRIETDVTHPSIPLTGPSQTHIVIMPTIGRWRHGLWVTGL